MNGKGRTPDEKFLIQLYKAALQKGSPHEEIDVRGVAAALGQKETAVKNIIKHLAQANFVKKVDPTTIYLTPHGANFVVQELHGN